MKLISSEEGGTQRMECAHVQAQNIREIGEIVSQIEPEVHVTWICTFERSTGQK